MTEDGSQRTEVLRLGSWEVGKLEKMRRWEDEKV